MISRSECQEIISEIERRIFDETPSKLGLSIGRELDDYSVAFLVLKDGMLSPAGTGTLVTFLGSHYFLTASHVWYEKLKNADTVVIPLKEGTRKRFAIRPTALTPFGPPKPKGWTEWGPDIILLRIPPEMIGAFIAVGRTFYNFSRLKPVAYIECGIECRFQVGAPAEKGVYTPQMALPEVQAILVLPETAPFFAPDQTKSSNPDFDFIDFPIDTSLPDVASNMKGVSGGGFWKVYIYKDSDGEFRALKRLEGVAFFETPRGSSTLVVRCHGPQSIGKTFWYLMQE